MKFKIKYVIIAITLIITMTGCAGQKSETSKSSVIGIPESGASVMTPGETDNKQETGKPEMIQVKEELMDQFYLDAQVTIPGKRFKTYRTSLKKFNQNGLVALLMSDAEPDQVQTENYEDGGAMITYNGESLVINLGGMRYIRDNEIQYVDELFSLAEMHNRLESKELSFQQSAQAAKTALDVLSQLGLGAAFSDPVIHAFTKDDMVQLQEYLLANDENFRALQNSGKLPSGNEFQEDEIYRITYTFTMDGLPVFPPSDPEIRISGGIDAPTPAYPVEAVVYVSESGIRFIQLDGVLEGGMEEVEENDIILIEGIKEALKNKYGDVILAEESQVTDIWLEYIPVMDAAEYGSVLLTPVWCCEFHMDNSDTPEGFPPLRYADRFHAFTGEEIS